MSNDNMQPEVNLEESRFGVCKVSSNGVPIIRYERHLQHPIEKVWRAITIAEHRTAWFPELSLEPRDGGTAVMDFGGGDCPPSESNPGEVSYCKVTAFDPPHLLEYSDDCETHRFELTVNKTGCTLVFTATLPPATEFDDEEQTIFSRFSVACGWHYKLDELEWTLDGTPFTHEGYAGPIKTRIYLKYMEIEDRKG